MPQQKRHPIIPIIPAERLIPEGNYCYKPIAAPSAANNWRYEVQPCPFWSINLEALKLHGKQSSGYCSYLREGDWESDSIGLLWDQLKACGVKDEDWREDAWAALKTAGPQAPVPFN